MSWETNMIKLNSGNAFTLIIVLIMLVMWISLYVYAGYLMVQSVDSIVQQYNQQYYELNKHNFER